MNHEQGRSAIFSSLFHDDFLARPFVRQTVLCPWFYLWAEAREGDEFTDEMLMIPSFDSLKDILEQQHEAFRVRSINYVTPGFVNKTGEWCMEPILEVTEGMGGDGRKISILTVAGRSYSQMQICSETELTDVQVLFTCNVDGKC